MCKENCWFDTSGLQNTNVFNLTRRCPICMHYWKTKPPANSQQLWLGEDKLKYSLILMFFTAPCNAQTILTAPPRMPHIVQSCHSINMHICSWISKNVFVSSCEHSNSLHPISCPKYFTHSLFQLAPWPLWLTMH